MVTRRVRPVLRITIGATGRMFGPTLKLVVVTCVWKQVAPLVSRWCRLLVVLSTLKVPALVVIIRGGSEPENRHGCECRCSSLTMLCGLAAKLLSVLFTVPLRALAMTLT